MSEKRDILVASLHDHERAVRDVLQENDRLTRQMNNVMANFDRNVEELRLLRKAV